MKEPKTAVAAMRAFALAHLPELCAELTEWHHTTILPDGQLRALAELCTFDLKNKLVHAERVVERLAIEAMASQSPAADTAHAEALRLLQAYRSSSKFSHDHEALKRTVALEDQIDAFLAAQHVPT